MDLDKLNNGGISARKSNPAVKACVQVIQHERKEALTTLFTILSTQNTPLPVAEECCRILAREMLHNPQPKYRDLIFDKVEVISKSKTLWMRKSFVHLITLLLDQDIYCNRPLIKLIYESTI